MFNSLALKAKEFFTMIGIRKEYILCQTYFTI